MKLAAAINQKAASLGQTERVSAVDLAQVFMASEGLCQYCGIDIGWLGVSFDHVVPFARGGRNVVSNLAASCITCQRTKFTKSPTEHAHWRGYKATCAGCGKAFKPRFSDYGRGYGKYCSRVCSGRAGVRRRRA